MSWTNEEIDKLFQDRVENLSFEYKDAYWKEFSAELPVFNSEAGVVNDDQSEIDQLYKEQSQELSFDYKNAYWQEMEAMLSQRRKRDFLWFATAVLFLGLLSTNLFNVRLGVTDSVNRSRALAQTNDGKRDWQAIQSEIISKNSSENLTETAYSNDKNGVNNAISNRNDDSSPELAHLATDASSEANDFVQSNSRAVSDEEVPTIIGENENIHVVQSDESTVLVTENGGASQLVAVNSDRKANDDVLDGDGDLSLEGDSDEAVLALATKRISQKEIDKSIIDLPESYRISDFKLPTRSVFYVELNGGISQSLITPSDRLSYSGGVGIGAQFQKGRFSFTTGVNGIWSFHDDIVLSRQAKVYGFGSQVYNYTLKYDHIYTIEGVLALGYRFGNHQINLGVRPSYAISSKVGFTQLSDNNDEVARRTVYGHMDGIQRFGVKPMIGYSVDLRRRFTLGVNIGTQIMPAVNEEFINGFNNKLPIDGQLYLRKTISFRR